ncbi:MAG: hypothetical protein ACREQB_10005, partial [Candidatus Binataceae bacterium]
TLAAPLAITIILISLDSAGAAFGPLIVLDALTFILATFVGLRLSFAMPAIAVARFGGLAAAWRQTEGAALRIFAINLLVLLPLTIAQYSAAALASFLGAHLTALIVRAAIDLTFNFVTLAGAATATALAYRRLTNEPAPPADPFAPSY